MGFASALKPDVPSFGYATLLSINTASIWGGVYPYLPEAYQSADVTALFYMVQMIAFLLMFCTAGAMTWRSSRWARKVHVAVFSAPLMAGPLMLIAAMYVEGPALAFIVAAAALVGVGSAGFLVSWQRVFAAMEAVAGTLALIKGTAASALLYFGLCLIPAALTSYLIPLVMVPLAGLCLWIAAGKTDVAQPMFEDVPREHVLVYRNALRESFPVAISIGAFGFCSGAIRFIAVTHQELLGMINIASMGFLLVVTVILFAVWRTRAFRLDLVTVFRVMFPVAGTCLVILPFAGEDFADAGFAVTYAFFALTCMLMMMHCAQISRDSGISPVFVYAFYAAVAYFMQMCGYVVGYASGSGRALGIEQLSVVAVVSLYVMLLVALFGRKVGKLHTSRLEFLMMSPRKMVDTSDSSALELSELFASDNEGGASDGEGGAPGASDATDADGALDPSDLPGLPGASDADGARGASDVDGADARLSSPSDATVRLDGRSSSDCRGVDGAAGGKAAAPATGFRGGAGSRLSDGAARGAEDLTALRCARARELYGLSSREAEVMELIVRGNTGPAIAEMLFISENTMRTHSKRIYAKMGVHKKQELVVLVEGVDVG